MPSEPGLTTSVAPGSSLLQTSAALIIGREPRLDLSDLVVLVPNLYVVSAMQQALHRAAGASAVLLPAITTLESWAKSVALAKSIVPESRRLALIHSALRKSAWFGNMDLWRVAADILALVNDCARHGIQLPQDVDDFQRVIRQALRATENHAVQFEARLVHEIGRALQRLEANEIDAPGGHALRLATLAQEADKPIFAVGLMELSKAEEAFFERYSRRQAVSIVNPGDAASSAESPLFAMLSSAWNTAASSDSLLQRAHMFQANHRSNPCLNRLGLFPAQSLEHEAQAVAMTLRRWLFEGKKSVAIIAQDRLTARRARALLERDAILIADESGWTMSTTTASSAVMGWLELIATDFRFRNLFELIRSPFIVAALTTAERQALAGELESLLISANYVDGQGRLRNILERPGVSPTLSRIALLLVANANLFTRKSQTLANWLSLTLTSLERLNVIQSMRLDAAGADLLLLLRTLQAELSDETEPYAFSDFRRWLDRQLENASFRDTTIDSSVVLTHLGLTDARAFDGVIILGADAEHLPSVAQSALFNESVSHQLGLPSQRERQNLERRRLMHVIANSGATFITWQGKKDGEANLPSSYWAQLMVFQRLAYDHDPIDYDLLRMLDRLGKSAQGDHPALSMPRPSAPELFPERLSAYDYGSLVACPYQFFVRRMLRLRASDEVLEALEKKDYGELVHRILSQFHQQYPIVGNHADAELNTEMHLISQTVFAAAPPGDYFARAWRLRWEAVIPAYLEWQREREQEGWRWQSGEITQEQTMRLASGQSVQLRGRLDRIDHRGNESGKAEFAVLDYKTGSNTALRKRAENPAEDSQLPFYGLIAEPRPTALAYVGLDTIPVKAFAMTGEVSEVVAAHRDRLEQTLSNIGAGASLPAHGADSVCSYCEAQGICRRRYWEDGSGV